MRMRTAIFRIRAKNVNVWRILEQTTRRRRDEKGRGQGSGVSKKKHRVFIINIPTSDFRPADHHRTILRAKTLNT